VLDTLGWVYYKKSSLRRAIQLLEESAQKNRTNPSVHYHLGMAYYKNGEHEAASHALGQSLTLDPTHADAQIVQEILAALQKK
jgi:Flp pilus assembly protein TadD